MKPFSPKPLIASLMVGSLLSFLLVTPTSAAAPDDGYPKDQPAPGRTCPIKSKE